MRTSNNTRPLGPEWRRASPYRWGGHVSPQFIVVLLLLHAVVLGWLCSDWNRIRLMTYDYVEVRSEEDINDSPTDIAAWGYREDAPEALDRFRAIAEPLTAGVSDAGDRARRLADYIYGLRTAPDGFDEDVRFGPSFLLDKMELGLHANCGQMSTVLATLWRSVGGHARAVRWGLPDGEIGHYALELWDQERERWFYYDMNLNGYGVDDDGRTPLSVASLRSNLLTGEDLHLVANPTAHDFVESELVEIVKGFPVESYVMNNTYLDWSPDRRFGWLNRFRGLLSRIPHPWDRLIDNLTGARDRRLLVEGRLSVAGLFTVRGARLFAIYLIGMILLCGFTLWRTASLRHAPATAPRVPGTPPSR